MQEASAGALGFGVEASGSSWNFPKAWLQGLSSRLAGMKAIEAWSMAQGLELACLILYIESP